jgi:DHA1 family inner membrane transport protein
MAGVAALVPRQPVDAGGVRRELAVFRRPQVWLALAMTTLGFSGVFASLTYIVPMMTGVAGFSPGAMTWLLVLFGAGLCAGNILGGRAADRRPLTSIYVILGSLATVLAIFTVTAHWQVPAVVTIALFGVAGFATVPPLQARVMDKAEGAPAMAAAANIGAFNLGNALGAWLGGLAIDAGFGYTAPNVVGTVLVLAGLGVAVLSGLLDQRRRLPLPLTHQS